MSLATSAIFFSNLKQVSPVMKRIMLKFNIFTNAENARHGSSFFEKSQ